MTGYFWERGITSLFSASGADTYDGELIWEQPANSGLTVRRMVLTVEFQMENTSGTWPPMPNVPVLFGVATTTSVGGAPTPPVNGPYTSFVNWNVWWDGLIWRPNYIAPAGTSIFDARLDIDTKVGHKLSDTDNESFWAGIEVLDNNGMGGSYFSDWYAIVYWSLLFAPTVT